MEKIYSRKRLKFSKPKKKAKIKIAFVLIILGLLLFFVQFAISVYPIFEESCKSKAETIGTEITSKEVNKVMTNYDYNDLVYIERSDTGEITMIKAKIVPINKIESEIVSDIRDEINKTSDTCVKMDFGSATGIAILSNIGPKFNIRLETARWSKYKFIFRIYRKWYKSNIA